MENSALTLMQHCPRLLVRSKHTLIKKVWGYERIIINRPDYCGKILTVLPNNKACSIHYHKRKNETFLILRGSLEFELWLSENPRPHSLEHFTLAEHKTLLPNDSITLHPYQAHRFWTTTEVTEFIEFSTYDEPSDSYRLKESGDICHPTNIS